MALGVAYGSSPSTLVPSERLVDNSSTDESPAHTAASIAPDDSGNTTDTTHTKAPAILVRICPHHTLSFQQLHQLATTPLLEEDRSLDTLVRIHPPHDYEVKDDTEPQICSQFYFRNSARFEPGFELSASWEVVWSRLQYSDHWKDDLRNVLERSDVWLCPHTRLCNSWVVNAMFRTLKQNEGGRTNKGLEGIRNHCNKCRTAVQVRCLTERPLQEPEALLQVNTKRQLGQGLREDDDDWLRQSVEPTDDKGDGSEIEGEERFHCGVQYVRGMIHPA